MSSSPRILLCDNHLLAVAKPGGMLTQPSPSSPVSLEAWAKDWVAREFHKPGAVFLHAVHRLDRPVSGVVLFARTSKALSRLNAAQRERRGEKEYRAVVHGEPVPAEGSWEDWLVHRRLHAAVAAADTPGARRARLRYRVLASRGGVSLVAVYLETGRYHQIRVQFASRSHPIVGDSKYDAPEELPAHAIALHHYRLVVPHPVRDARVDLVAALPRHGPWRLVSA